MKGLITSPFQQIEAKGVDPIRLKQLCLAHHNHERGVGRARR